MRVLAVVLYVAVLLCFTSVAAGAWVGDTDINGIEYCGSSDLEYNPATGQKMADTDFPECICYSGYNGTLCDSIVPDYCAEEMKYVLATKATDFPILEPNVTTFRNNRLRTAIISPYVQGRKFLELNFRNATDKKCSIGYPGSFWTKSANCSDRFSLDLPWTEHRGCGFFNDTKNTDPEKMVITGFLWIRYSDEIDEIEDFNLTRNVNVPYKMSVTFQRFITVELLKLNITSDVHFGVALTGDEFNPEDGHLTLELTTIINYPNMFHPLFSSMVLWPDQVEIFYGRANYNLTGATEGKNVSVAPISRIAATENGQTFCDVTLGACKQVWRIDMAIKAGNDSCTFDGDYTASFELYTCRGMVSSVPEFLGCTHTTATVNFTLSSSDVCGEVGIKPNVEGELVAFRDSFQYSQLATSYAQRSTNFKLGEYAKFYAKIDSDGNDITITFNEVKFAIKPAVGEVNESDWVMIYKDGSLASTPHIGNIHFEANHADKAFRLYFHSSVFKVPPQETVTYIITANCTIVFEGNQGETKKRTVEYTYQASAMESSTKVGLSSNIVAPKAAAGNTVVDNTNVSPVTFIASVVGAVAGTLIIVFVVVGFALRARSQSDKRDAPASAAVSAANAAAATIEVAVNRA